jgi:hypothetical protein
MGLPLDTFVLPLRVTAVGADATLFGCAAGTVLNTANYAPPAIKISTKLTVKGMVRIRMNFGSWIDPHLIQNSGALQAQNRAGDAHNSCVDA